MVEDVRPLLLVGGYSSRMGVPKHMLRLPTGKTLFAQLVEVLHQTVQESLSRPPSLDNDKHTGERVQSEISLLDPHIPLVVYVSVRDKTQGEGVLRLIAEEGILIPIELLYDNAPDASNTKVSEIQASHRALNTLERNGSLVDHSTNTSEAVQKEIGPASGLLSAVRHSPSSTWLVLACDFPLITIPTLLSLLSQYEHPVTCFQNSAGFCEPLAAVWSPEALRRLGENVARGMTGPSRTVRDLGGKTIKLEPANEALMGANTPDEWEMCMDAFRTRKDYEQQ